jgi:hypothetical protein
MLLEDRVITDFVAALDEENIPALRRVVSTDFQQKALRSDDVLRDLEIVKLPSGELEILKVDEPSDGQRNVIVSDVSGEKYKFELVRDTETEHWTVNDVLVRQQKKWKKVRSTVTWPTSQVLDLVFSVREYLDAWVSAERGLILSKSSPALASSLESVPPLWLPVITHGISSNYDSSLARKPEAQLNDKSAVVRMPVQGGYLLVSAVQIDNRWLMDDIEIHSKSNSGHPGSVKRQADAVGSLGRFLTGFSSGDKETLQANATSDFYDGTLQFADLSLVSLPSPEVAPSELSIRSFAGRVTIIMPTEREFIRFDLVDPDRDAEKHVARGDAPRQFHVDDVVLNDRSRRNERTLGSIFTAPARASLFIAAVQSRDLEMLKQLSTREFNDTVWDQVPADMVSRLTLPSNHFRQMELEGSDVRGNRTDLTFRANDGGIIKCRMVEQIGRLLVDDIQFPNADNQVTSLRVQSALQIPIVAFTAAWRANDLELLKPTCSTAFDRMALNHFVKFPLDTVHLADRLDTALRSIRVTEERATVSMGLPSSDTAVVHLVQEHEHWVIDDISIPHKDGEMLQVRNHLKEQVKNSMLSLSPTPVRRLNPRPLKSVMETPVPVQPGIARPVQVIHDARGTISEDSKVIRAAHQVFGPDSAAVSRKLENPLETAIPIPTEEPHTLPLDPASEIPNSKLIQEPVKPLADGPFLNFGPMSQPPESAATVSGNEKPRASVATKPRGKVFDLAENPVSID